MRSGILLGAVLLLSIATRTRAKEGDFKFMEEDMTDLLVEEQELTKLEEELEEQIHEKEYRKKLQEEFLKLEEDAQRKQKPYFHNEYYDDQEIWMNDASYVNDDGDNDGSGSGDYSCADEDLRQCANPSWKFCEIQRCDGNNDCPDADDEEGCSCKQNEFQCDNIKCILNEKQCDERQDCVDGTDEENCNDNLCMDEEQLPCAAPKSSYCKSQRCDGSPDCPDGDDEDGCNVECGQSEFQCDSSKCISIDKRCDGQKDCMDKTDEINCDIECALSEFQCDNTKCITIDKKCDGQNDCKDKTDEKNCDCEKTEFRCDGVCLPLNKKCDKVNDCSDGADEKSCECSENKFSCDGKCILLSKRCNGKKDCRDSSDETNCECMYMGTGYNKGGRLPGMCAELTCDKGKWLPTGNINEECNECTLYNDPHIKTYENLTYDWHGQCNYSITQQGKKHSPKFALYGKFDPCLPGISSPTCIGEFVYKDSDTLMINFGAQMSQVQKKINLFYVTVNGVLRPVVSSQFATPLSVTDTENDVLAWRVDDCLRILGTKGIMINYCGWGIHVWAHPSIKKSVYGLCGRITGGSSGLEGRDGTQYNGTISPWPKNQINTAFAVGWQTNEQTDSCTSGTRRSKRQTQNSACEASKAELTKYKKDCSDKIEDEKKIEDCAFDRCVITEANKKNPGANYPKPDEWLNESKKRAKREVDIKKNTNDIKATTTATTLSTTTATTTTTTTMTTPVNAIISTKTTPAVPTKTSTTTSSTTNKLTTTTVSTTTAATTLVPFKGCGEILEDVMGELNYPENGSQYNNSVNCYWLISTPPGTTIQISFKEINTEKCCDFLSVWDGSSTSAPKIGNYSGDVLPAAIYSVSNHLYIRFVSDESKPAEGFKLTWEVKGCLEELEGSSGEISFPDDGQQYGHNRTCTWSIKSLPDTVIKINFITFNTEKHYDNLTIWDGKNDTSAILSSFSGSRIPAEQISSSNHVYLQFTSDSHGSGMGFRLTWQQIQNNGCENLEFKCDAKCLSLEQRCDGNKDCEDNSDESWCECEYAGKIYDDGALLQDICASLICKHGKWYPTGYISQDCSECTLYNDPHIKTYEDLYYDWHGQCNYSITQEGKSQTPGFALYGKFDECLPGISNPTCIGEFVYKDSDTLSVSFGSAMAVNKKENDMFYITVNGFSQLVNTSHFALGLEIGESKQEVLAWRDGGCLKILGTRGLMINYCGWGIHIWAHPKISNSIYGLCGLHSGSGGSPSQPPSRRKLLSLIGRDGTPYGNSIDSWPNNQIDSDFADSWKTQFQSRSCANTRRRKRQTQNSGCQIDPASSQFDKYRTVCSYKVDQNLPAVQKQRIIDDCAFDRCVIMTAKDNNPSGNYPDPDNWLNQTQNRSKRQAEINKNTVNITANSTMMTTTVAPTDITTVPSDIVHPCGSNLSDSEGTLKFPGGSDNYSNNDTCYWTITSPKGINITLTFETFDTQLDADFLYIRDGGSEKSDLLGALSGNFGIPKLTSSSNYLYLRFTSDPSVTAAGFTIKWKANTGDCFYNGTTYKEDEKLPKICAELVCKGGKWHPTGQINIQCSECTVYNDPHFNTFENVRYDWHGQCNYSITQKGKSMMPEFALYAQFDECMSNKPNPTCLGELVYKDAEDVKVDFGASYMKIQNGRSLFHVIVNGQKQMVTSSFAESLNGTTSSILAWEENGCLKIIGTQGLTIQYCGWGLHVWAHSDLQNKLYGLCGRNSNKTESNSSKYTRKSADGLMARNGIYYSRPVIGWPNNQVDDEFAESWETQEQPETCPSKKDSQRRRKRAIKDSACKADKEKLLKYKEDCGAKVSKDLPDTQHQEIIEDCAFDRCVLVSELDKNNSSALPDPEVWLNKTANRAQRQLYINNNNSNFTDATKNPYATTPVIGLTKATTSATGPSKVTTPATGTTKTAPTTMKTTINPSTGCGNNERPCKNGQCIPSSKWCNHVYDCSDNSDEIACKATSTTSQPTTSTTSRITKTSSTTKTPTAKTSLKPGCGFGMWRCNDGQCIKFTNRCNKNYDCTDKSDENQCTSCDAGKWQCTDTSCIDANKRCNGKYDCLDYSDEKNCKMCEIGQWQCKEGSCIEEFQRCDGVYDCFDHSDEVNCKDKESPQVFVCHEGTRLFWWQRCDRIYDCPDYSDEFNCNYWNYWG